MDQRGRKSTAALATVTKLSQGKRLAPPAHLSAEERAIWRETVDNRPWDWFGPEQVPLLEAYCRHLAYASCIGRALKKMTVTGLLDKDQVQHHAKLLVMHGRETKAATLLAGQMRLTNQSRIDVLAAGRENRHFQNAGKAEPWDG